MLYRPSVLLIAAAFVPLCAAFSPTLPLATRVASRSSAGVCSVHATATQGGIVQRRSFLAAGLALAGGALLPVVPAFAETAEKKALSGNYQDDVANLLVSMKAATDMKKGDPTMKDVVLKARADMNEFVAFYRRNTKVSGAASFSTLYTAISTLSGHFQNYGPEFPVPLKRQKRLAQQYAEVEKQISRGR